MKYFFSIWLSFLIIFFSMLYIQPVVGIVGHLIICWYSGHYSAKLFDWVYS